MRVNYNVSSWAGEEKAAGAGTMESNGKNNAQNNGNSRASGRVVTPGWTPADRRGRWARVAAKRDATVPHGIFVISGGNEMPAGGSGARRSQKSKTRISAIADFAEKGKREKKALRLFLPRCLL